jgi:hypothetical protein
MIYKPRNATPFIHDDLERIFEDRHLSAQQLTWLFLLMKGVFSKKKLSWLIQVGNI